MGTVLIIVIVVLLLLAAAGAYAQRRRLAATEEQWHLTVQRADHDLAAAVAGDRGWEYERLEAAARQAFASANPGAPGSTSSRVASLSPAAPAGDCEKET